ncbi:tRNA-specific adenosine deaminase 1 [Ostrinia nubilalis]|uniref:tRNA-specific adenosine deaminase 1 n=1 Tax=Ostrinia nubilalis TaxID=29057 RepID=UPI00308226E7
MSFDFDESVADRAVKKFLEVYEKLPNSGKPNYDEYTVLSGILLFDRSTGYTEVISIGTGTKCISGAKLSPLGNILNDSHAEIIARRGLLVYLYEAMKRTAEGQMTVLKMANGKFELPSNYELHFYTSQLPCGDATILPTVKLAPDEECLPLESNKRKADDDISDIDKKKELRVIPDVFRTGAKCLPHCEQDTKEPGDTYHLLGQVRTKPGRGERTLSVSCTDKIAKWMHLGLQGSLMGLLFNKPIYLKSIIIGGGVPFSQECLKRALVLRNPNFTIENIPTFEQSSVVFPHKKSETRYKAGPTSIIWVNLDNGYPEVACFGIRRGTTKKHINYERTFLSICKYVLYQRFVEVLLLLDKDTVPGTEAVLTIPYNKMKRKNKWYYEKWEIVKEVFFKAWTKKPDMWDFCADSKLMGVKPC